MEMKKDADATIASLVVHSHNTYRSNLTLSAFLESEK
jgi:hypothetical protein